MPPSPQARIQKMKSREHKLIDLLKQGENGAYKYIYDNYYVLLCSIAYEYLQDDFLAEDIVDDLIFSLWEKRSELNIATSLRSYLIKSVRNRCINYLTRSKEKNEVSFSRASPSEKLKIHSSHTFEYPSAILLVNELEEKIYQAIENLPNESKAVFKMSRFENKGYDQIAHEMNISVNTVKYHIKRALAQLNQELSKYLLFLLIVLV